MFVCRVYNVAVIGFLEYRNYTTHLSTGLQKVKRTFPLIPAVLYSFGRDLLSYSKGRNFLTIKQFCKVEIKQTNTEKGDHQLCAALCAIHFGCLKVEGKI